MNRRKNEKKNLSEGGKGYRIQLSKQLQVMIFLLMAAVVLTSAAEFLAVYQNMPEEFFTMASMSCHA
jgi:hypothetical protein